MKTGVSLKYFLNNCLWRLFCLYLTVDDSKLKFLTILVALSSFTWFSYKLRTIQLQNFPYLANGFPVLPMMSQLDIKRL